MPMPPPSGIGNPGSAALPAAGAAAPAAAKGAAAPPPTPYTRPEESPVAAKQRARYADANVDADALLSAYFGTALPTNTALQTHLENVVTPTDPNADAWSHTPPLTSLADTLACKFQSGQELTRTGRHHTSIGKSLGRSAKGLWDKSDTTLFGRIRLPYWDSEGRRFRLRERAFDKDGQQRASSARIRAMGSAAERAGFEVGARDAFLRYAERQAVPTAQRELSSTLRDIDATARDQKATLLASYGLTYTTTAELGAAIDALGVAADPVKATAIGTALAQLYHDPSKPGFQTLCDAVEEPKMTTRTTHRAALKAARAQCATIDSKAGGAKGAAGKFYQTQITAGADATIAEARKALEYKQHIQNANEAAAAFGLHPADAFRLSTDGRLPVWNEVDAVQKLAKTGKVKVAGIDVEKVLNENGEPTGGYSIRIAYEAGSPFSSRKSEAKAIEASIKAVWAQNPKLTYITVKGGSPNARREAWLQAHLQAYEKGRIDEKGEPIKDQLPFEVRGYIPDPKDVKRLPAMLQKAGAAKAKAYGIELKQRFVDEGLKQQMHAHPNMERWFNNIWTVPRPSRQFEKWLTKQPGGFDLSKPAALTEAQIESIPNHMNTWLQTPEAKASLNAFEIQNESYYREPWMDQLQHRTGITHSHIAEWLEGREPTFRSIYGDQAMTPEALDHYWNGEEMDGTPLQPKPGQTYTPESGETNYKTWLQTKDPDAAAAAAGGPLPPATP